MMKEYDRASSDRPMFRACLKERSVLLKAAFVLLGAVCTAQVSPAQITNEIEANISHSFIVGNTTLPPGQYDFRLISDSDLSTMTVTSADGKHSIEFLVREAQADHIPQHSELIFNRYGQKEFLSKIFEQGTRLGSAIAEVPRDELRLQKKGQHPAEHAESASGT